MGKCFSSQNNQEETLKFESAECIICFEDLKIYKVHETTCKHFFHYKCLKGWIDEENNDDCPLCRHHLGYLKYDV